MLKKREGFTLIEMMIVVSIIGLLLSIVIPDLITTREKAKVKTCAASLEGIQKALELYRLDTKQYPVTLEKMLNESYLAEKTLRDPWLEKFYYKPVVKKANKKIIYYNYVLLSKGPDQILGSSDDILAPRDSNRHNLAVLSPESTKTTVATGSKEGLTEIKEITKEQMPVKTLK